jgi:hypothetical protein
MLNESSVGNVSFRNIPAEKRVGLRIGGVGLTLQQNTWNNLVRLTEDIGIVQPEVEVEVEAEVEAEAMGDSNSDDEEAASYPEESITEESMT